MIQRSSLTALWPQSGMPDRAARTRPQQTWLALALVVGIVLILCLYLFQASRTTAKEHDIYTLQQRHARLQRENSNMLASLAYHNSITQMNRRAVAAGFGPARTQPRYVVVSPASPAAANLFTPPAALFQPEDEPARVSLINP